MLAKTLEKGTEDDEGEKKTPVTFTLFDPGWWPALYRMLFLCIVVGGITSCSPRLSLLLSLPFICACRAFSLALRHSLLSHAAAHPV